MTDNVYLGPLERNGVDAFVGRRIAEEVERQKLQADTLFQRAGVPAYEMDLCVRGLAHLDAGDLMMILIVIDKTPAWLFEGFAPGRVGEMTV